MWGLDKTHALSLYCCKALLFSQRMNNTTIACMLWWHRNTNRPHFPMLTQWPCDVGHQSNTGAVSCTPAVMWGAKVLQLMVTIQNLSLTVKRTPLPLRQIRNKNLALLHARNGNLCQVTFSSSVCSQSFFFPWPSTDCTSAAILMQLELQKRAQPQAMCQCSKCIHTNQVWFRSPALGCRALTPLNAAQTIQIPPVPSLYLMIWRLRS